ncbi:MAG: hypothetical protein K9N35_01380 [Candidatus Marinimicrobia bacterium]|nr:hypothetical protein [Candidatus Neomarinimicrobiota bacterium]
MAQALHRQAELVSYTWETRAKTRLVIWLDALMQGMSVNMDATLLEPLNRERRTI